MIIFNLPWVFREVGQQDVTKNVSLKGKLKTMKYPIAKDVFLSYIYFTNRQN